MKSLHDIKNAAKTLISVIEKDNADSNHINLQIDELSRLIGGANVRRLSIDLIGRTFTEDGANIMGVLKSFVTEFNELGPSRNGIIITMEITGEEQEGHG